MPPLSTTQLQKYLPSSSPSVTTTTSSSPPPLLLPERPPLLSQPSPQQPLPSNHHPPREQQHHTPAPISRWLPDSSTFFIKSYLPMNRHKSSSNNRIELVNQNYCFSHKTYYAYSWCPSCQTQIIF
ncbi:hypothetical protein INT45_002218 [Circinella minor]|uniref:Uncharacterized protein n=1 Tax=Circinella minor TaxID=1195481 RepID=A0A8H7SG85_9FUNG|nr:hypothetical protein INT45_002218 [Circinella minor]